MYLKLNVSRHLPFLVIIFIYLFANLFIARDVLLHGRFWAEEGTLYWANAFYNTQTKSLLAHLVFLAPAAGYLNFVANIFTFLAVLIGGVYFSPLVTTWLSFLVMLLPSTVVYLYFNDRTRLTRTIISTLILFSPPALSGEIFANSINSQVFLALASILFLFTKTMTSKLKISYYFILLVSALSTMYVSILIPFYLIHFFMNNKNRIYLHGFYILLICGITQYFYRYFYPYSYLFYQRNDSMSLSKFLETMVLSIVNFFAGNFSVLIFKNLFQNSLIYVIFSVVFFGVILFYNNYIKSTYNTWMAIMLFFSFCLFISYGAVNQVGYGRYGFIPGSLVGLILFFNFENLISRESTKFVLLFFTLCFSVYLFNYPHLREFISKPNFCSEWSVQIDRSKLVAQSDLLFWPCYENPIWKIESRNIKPTLMDFQVKILKSDNQSL